MSGNKDLSQAITAILDHAVATGIIQPEDRRWAANRILEMLGEPQWEPGLQDSSLDFYQALDFLSTHGVEKGLAETTDMAISALMGALMPRPSQVSRTFDALLEVDPRAATDYLHDLSVASDYIKTRQVARNVKWTTPTRWGDLEITINLSKPEKDPRAIAQAAAATADGAYPACQLCMENEGYAGRGPASALGTHPPRQDLRIALLGLGGETWGLQYSPYAYYEEHCIAMSQMHRPMKIDQACFMRLLLLVGTFPHYFFGSNADLPIVGGSILAHDHFQGGMHVFPMELAADEASFSLKGFPGVQARTIAWPVSVIRLTRDDPVELAGAANLVLDTWRSYSDDQAGIVPMTGDTPHNTITPIARRRGDAFELDLALRCNITTEDRPLGLFHPRPELHHIKKENIGLIEVMGLAILPPRLERELEAVADALLAGTDLSEDEATAPHAAWARELAARHPELDEDTIQQVLRDEVGAVFGQVLEDAGVFKWDEAGRQAQARFLEQLG